MKVKLKGKNMSESLGFKLQLSQLKTQWHGKWQQSKPQLKQPAAKTFKTYAEKTNRENLDINLYWAINMTT